MSQPAFDEPLIPKSSKKSDMSFFALWIKALCSFFRTEKHIQFYQDFATADQVDMIMDLRERIEEKGDGEAEKDSLQLLWRTAFPDQELPTPLEQHENWKKLGFQNSDPRTDFRAAGLAGLQSILWFAEKEHTLFRDIVDNGREYPFCASALNIHQILIGHLQLSSDPINFCPCCKHRIRSDTHSRVELRGFLHFHENYQGFLPDLFCIACRIMDEEFSKLYKTDKLALLNFEKVLTSTWARIKRVLTKEPESMAQFYKTLKIKPSSMRSEE
eukprot:TRINITY_DN2765_c0_g1_i1.p1 TRINITY_DN2765_c0_g1~~TRINITY_DN2765_c0_g1_i1.p1  ORF type:complete len:272 (-),score=57.01 TRINITY_DN2765_c0_g1_i1:323-1138(-)